VERVIIYKKSGIVFSTYEEEARLEVRAVCFREEGPGEKGEKTHHKRKHSLLGYLKAVLKDLLVA